MHNRRVPTTRRQSVLLVLVNTVFHRASLVALLRYARTVMRDFFFLQFSVKFGLKKIVVLNVDHPLDRTVPFRPEKVGVYLDFVAFWVVPSGTSGEGSEERSQPATPSASSDSSTSAIGTPPRFTDSA
jgi:hypothetical protein